MNNKDKMNLYNKAKKYYKGDQGIGKLSFLCNLSLCKTDKDYRELEKWIDKFIEDEGVKRCNKKIKT